jgi:hypothetical protein
MRELINEVSAILSLVPGAQVTMNGDIITWHDPIEPPITNDQINQEKERLLQEYDAKEYQRLRQPEYPPLADLADALYWQSQGNDIKMAAYLAAVDAVKVKFPKGVA